MASLFVLPFVPALTLPGLVAGAATLTFYLSGTSTLAPIYDADGDALPNPITADAFGRFEEIYLGDLTYRVVLKSILGAVIQEVDPYAAPSAATLPFTQSGTGAVSRSIQSKLRETVSAEDYGAIGDGVADDTAALQAALNHRGTINLLGKTYKFSSPLTVRAGTSLIGAANSKLLWAGPVTGNMMQDSSITSPSDVNQNIYLEGFEIDGGDLVSGDAAQVAINFYRTGNVVIRGLKVHGVGGSGIRWGNSFIDTVNVLVEDCEIWDCRQGDALQGSGRRITLQNNKIGKPGSTTSNFGDTGIALLRDFNGTTNPGAFTTSGVIIENNTIVGNYNGAGVYVGVGQQIQTGIAFGPFANNADANIQVRGNTVTNCYLNLWAIVMANVTVEGNTFGPHSATATGNVRFDGVTGSQILNNVISRGYAQTGSDYSNILLVAQRNTFGLSVFDSDVVDVTISGNLLSSAVAGNGIRATFEQINSSPSYTSKLTRVAVRGNTFTGIGTRVALAPVSGTTAATCNDLTVQGNKSDSTSGSLIMLGGIPSQYTDTRLVDNTAPVSVAPFSGTGSNGLTIQHKASGKVSAPTGTATTIAALPAGYYAIDVNAFTQGGAAAQSALTSAVVANTDIALRNTANGANMTITLSGANLQATQTTGSTNDIYYTITYR